MAGTGGSEGRARTPGLDPGVRIYLNAQFASSKHRDRLLSVGMVSEAGEFYRVMENPNAIEIARHDPWMREHVLPRLPYEEEGRDWLWSTEHPDYSRMLSPDGLVDDLLDFVDSHTDPELWGWQAGFAYVAIRHLFGKLTDRPNGFPLWCGELMAGWHGAGEPELPPRGMNGHHALEQARWARDVDCILENLEQDKVANSMEGLI